MSSLALSAAMSPAGFGAEVFTSYDKASRRLERLAEAGAATPFQREGWLRAWYESRKGAAAVEPLIVFVADSQTGADVLGLALARTHRDGFRVIEFADDGISDYNGPVLGPQAPQDLARAQQLWKIILKCLPPSDVVRLVKMPVQIGALRNPLALLKCAAPSRLCGNILEVGGPWDDYHWALERTFRKELERSWRVFSKVAGASFQRVTSVVEAQRIYSQLRRLQSERISGLGLDYVLDREENDRVYSRLIEDGLARGTTILTALTVGDEVVAALLGISDGQTFAMVRLAAAAGEWKKCSPGRLLIERTMRALHAERIHKFDFTIGDYSYKRRLGALPAPLTDIVVARSLRGLPEAGRSAVTAFVRKNPALMALARRIRG